MALPVQRLSTLPETDHQLMHIYAKIWNRFLSNVVTVTL